MENRGETWQEAVEQSGNLAEGARALLRSDHLEHITGSAGAVPSREFFVIATWKTAEIVAGNMGLRGELALAGCYSALLESIMNETGTGCMMVTGVNLDQRVTEPLANVIVGNRGGSEKDIAALIRVSEKELLESGASQQTATFKKLAAIELAGRTLAARRLEGDQQKAIIDAVNKIREHYHELLKEDFLTGRTSQISRASK